MILLVAVLSRILSTLLKIAILIRSYSVGSYERRTRYLIRVRSVRRISGLS
jgi:hypothetical protein